MPRAPRIDPAIVTTWTAAAERLRAAGRGERTALVRELQATHGLGSMDAVYRRLREYGGWDSAGRSGRTPAGAASRTRRCTPCPPSIARGRARTGGAS